MSDKKRRDITLGEMQDECKKRTDCRPCPYKSVCFCQMVSVVKSPATIDLTDPPRFTEPQMALLKALWGSGARSIIDTRDGLSYVRSENGSSFARLNTCIIGLNDGETLDLAELFGKEEIK